MIQVEQSTFDKIAAKEADWGFSDLEEDGIYDMRMAMENTYLFGVKRLVNHVSKNGMNTWFTGGIWWMAGKDIEVEWGSRQKYRRYHRRQSRRYHKGPLRRHRYRQQAQNTPLR